MIKFGYLEGYNAINVPEFNTAALRDTYFDSCVDYTIDAYYPPYYTNVIKVDIDEVPQSTPINFVILVHNQKYYYYFVDHFNYINEDIYEIVINMDTVLTHMFDYKINQGLLTRKSIARWNSTLINRDYVRENVSEGIMEVNSFTYKNTNKYLIVTTSECLVDIQQPRAYYRKGYTNYDIGYYVYAFPLPTYPIPDTATIKLYYHTQSSTTFVIDVNYRDIISYFIDNSYTINMMITESAYLDKILNPTWLEMSPYTLIYLYYDYSFSSSSVVRINEGTEESPVYKYLWGLNLSLLPLEDQSDNIVAFNFHKNTNIKTTFNKDYIPQLLDENYIQVEYGDINGFTSYPLHQLKSTSLDCYNSLDVTTCNNGYYLKDPLDTDNKHNTYIFSLGLTFDLITDAWKQYQAQNKGTLSTGLQLQMVNTLYSTAKNTALAVGTGGMSNAMGSESIASLTRQGNANMRTPTAISDGIMQGINVIANYQINRENLEYTPDTVKGRGNLYSMLISKYKSPYVKKLMVNDIVNCAKKLEEYGYRVNEVVDTKTNIFDLCNIRYYYNFVAIRVNSYDTLCFIPNDIINDINDRLKNGLRFINITSCTAQNLTIPEIFSYDNIENSEIGGNNNG